MHAAARVGPVDRWGKKHLLQSCCWGRRTHRGALWRHQMRLAHTRCRDPASRSHWAVLVPPLPRQFDRERSQSPQNLVPLHLCQPACTCRDRIIADCVMSASFGEHGRASCASWPSRVTGWSVPGQYKACGVACGDHYRCMHASLTRNIAINNSKSLRAFSDYQRYTERSVPAVCV